MFERFTDRARRAVVLAQSEAGDEESPAIGSEHLLAGLAIEGSGLAGLALTQLDVTADRLRNAIRQHRSGQPARGRPISDRSALASIGIDLDDIVRAVEAAFGAGALRIEPLHIPFTEHATEAVEQSLGRAVELGLSYIGTEHVLLGICSVSNTGAEACLQSIGVSIAEARRATLALMEEHGTAGVIEHAGRLDEVAAARRRIREAITGLDEARRASAATTDEELSAEIQAAHERLIADSVPLDLTVFRRAYAHEIEPLLMEVEGKMRETGMDVPEPMVVSNEYGGLVARWNAIQQVLAGVDADHTEVREAAEALQEVVNDRARQLAADWQAAVPDDKFLRRRHVLELEEALAKAHAALEETGIDAALFDSA